jgi:hypothetical protein
VVDDEHVERVELVGPSWGAGRHRLALRVQVEQDPDIAELERRIDQHDLLAEVGGRRDRQVHRDGRSTDAALGAEDRDDPTRIAAAVARRRTATRTGRRDRHGRHAAGLVALA